MNQNYTENNVGKPVQHANTMFQNVSKSSVYYLNSSLVIKMSLSIKFKYILKFILSYLEPSPNLFNCNYEEYITFIKFNVM